MSELWVYVDAFSKEGEIELSPDEGRHVTTRRLRVGDPLVVFDGRGQYAEGRLISAERRHVRVECETIHFEPRAESGFVLASAIPKGDRLSTMLQMLSQLGVESWRPLVLQESATRKLDPESPRLRRILIESCKLARRSWALEVLAPMSLAEVLDVAEGAIFYGDREGDALPLDARAGLLLIGPEAGFTPEEIVSIRSAGGLPRAFSSHNLRIETAAIAGAVAHHLGRGGP